MRKVRSQLAETLPARAAERDEAEKLRANVERLRAEHTGLRAEHTGLLLEMERIRAERCHLAEVNLLAVVNGRGDWTGFGILNNYMFSSRQIKQMPEFNNCFGIKTPRQKTNLFIFWMFFKHPTPS